MARQRNEKRIKAKELFLESDGTASNSELAEALGVSSAKISKWKCMDNWKEALQKKPRKRGGQKKNQNAKGHGAPKGNRNAETHGAYSKVDYESFTEEEKANLHNLTLDSATNMLEELKKLIAKEQDLEKRIAKYKNEERNELYVDKVVELRTANKKSPGLKATMETVIKSSAFERRMKLEAELNKIHGRIIRLLESIKSYELEQHRIEMEEKRYCLMKQKLSGVYDVDLETGEINDVHQEESL